MGKEERIKAQSNLQKLPIEYGSQRIILSRPADRISAENINNPFQFYKTTSGLTNIQGRDRSIWNLLIHFHMKRPWCSLAKSMLEAIRHTTLTGAIAHFAAAGHTDIAYDL